MSIRSELFKKFVLYVGILFWPHSSVVWNCTLLNSFCFSLCTSLLDCMTNNVSTCVVESYETRKWTRAADRADRLPPNVALEVDKVFLSVFWTTKNANSNQNSFSKEDSRQLTEKVFRLITGVLFVFRLILLLVAGLESSISKLNEFSWGSSLDGVIILSSQCLAKIGKFSWVNLFFDSKLSFKINQDTYNTWQ